MINKVSIAIIGLGRIGILLAQGLFKLKVSQVGLLLDDIYLIGHDKESVLACQKDFEDFVFVEAMYADNRETYLEAFKNCYFTTNFESLAKADLIICTYGSRLKTIITDRRDLLLQHGRLTTEIGAKIKHYAKKEAFLLNIVNPIESITWRLKEITGLPYERVIGVSGTHDIARFAHVLCEALDNSLEAIDSESLYVIGEHGNHMVPLLSHVKVDGAFLAKDVDTESILKKTLSRGIDIFSLRGVPPYLGPVSSLVSVCKNILLGKRFQTTMTLFHSDHQCYVMYPCVIEGMNGVVDVVQNLSLSEDEQMKFLKSIKMIKTDFDSLGNFK